MSQPHKKSKKSLNRSLCLERPLTRQQTRELVFGNFDQNLLTSPHQLLSNGREMSLRHHSGSGRTHLNPCSEAQVASSWLPKYFVGFLLICAIAWAITEIRENGYIFHKIMGKELKDDIHMIKNQMSHLKMAMVQVTQKKEDVDKLVLEINKFVSDFKKFTEGGYTDDDSDAESTSAVMSTLDGVIQHALDVYDADKTGKADYALESAGGSIVSTENTKNFLADSRITFLGWTLCGSTKGPRALIQPSMIPGDCWAFKGPTGSVIIKLLTVISVTAITIEHISKAISPTQEISSAPKEFSVYALQYDDEDKKEHCLGKFIYKKCGSSLQTFPISSYLHMPTDKVKIVFHSNHGNPKYTCVYRVRVHGKMADKNALYNDIT